MGIMRDMTNTIRSKQNVVGVTLEQLDVCECMAALERIDATMRAAVTGLASLADSDGLSWIMPADIAREAWRVAIAAEEERERLVRGNGELENTP